MIRTSQRPYYTLDPLETQILSCRTVRQFPGNGSNFGDRAHFYARFRPLTRFYARALIRATRLQRTIPISD